MNEDPASLDRLHGLAVPEPISIWPLAAGWWVLLALLALVTAAVVIRLVLRHRANAYRRAALAEIGELEATIDFAALLKRTALSAWPREEVAALGGERWIAWLGKTGASPVPDTTKTLLLETPYLDPGNKAPPELRDFVADWIRSHRR